MKMTGTVWLDCCIVFAAGVPLATITSGAVRSNSVAADRNQSASPKPRFKIDLDIAAANPTEFL